MSFRDNQPSMLDELDRELNSALRVLLRVGLILGVTAVALSYFNL